MTQNYQSLDFFNLRTLYKSRKSNPTEIIKSILERIREEEDTGIWISRVSESDVLNVTNKDTLLEIVQKLKQAHSKLIKGI